MPSELIPTPLQFQPSRKKVLDFVRNNQMTTSPEKPFEDKTHLMKMSFEERYKTTGLRKGKFKFAFVQ